MFKWDWLVLEDTNSKIVNHDIKSIRNFLVLYKNLIKSNNTLESNLNAIAFATIHFDSFVFTKFIPLPDTKVILYLTTFFFSKSFDVVYLSQHTSENTLLFKPKYLAPTYKKSNQNQKKRLRGFDFLFWENKQSFPQTIKQRFLLKWEKIVDSYLRVGFFKKKYFYKTTTVGIDLSKTKNKIVSTTSKYIFKPKFSSTNIAKLFQLPTSFEFQFLRKNKVYNKGRYSRTRQNYRTGVYMCMYLSILSIFGLYYWFFKFSFNFTYLWWFFIAVFASFFLPKIIKNRFYEPRVFINKIFELSTWLYNILRGLFF